VALAIFYNKNAVYFVGCAAHRWSRPNVMHMLVRFAITSFFRDLAPLCLLFLLAF
jgi:hypothetical protein